jgi:hypothetical protein
MAEKNNTKKALALTWKILDDNALGITDVQTIINGLQQWVKGQAEPLKVAKGDEVKAFWPEGDGSVIEGVAKKVAGEYIQVTFADGDVQWVHVTFITKTTTPEPKEESKKE